MKDLLKAGYNPLVTYEKRKFREIMWDETVKRMHEAIKERVHCLLGITKTSSKDWTPAYDGKPRPGHIKFQLMENCDRSGL